MEDVVCDSSSEGSDSNGSSNNNNNNISNGIHKSVSKTNIVRSLSDHNGKVRKRKHMNRCLSDPGPDKEDTVSGGLLAVSQKVVEKAEDLVRKVILAGRRLVHHHHLPDWLQDNEHLVFGHRLPLSSFRECFKSVFRIHTETANIWTRLLGMVAFISLATYTLTSRYMHWVWQDITVYSVFFTGAILCLTFSWIFHTVFCHSVPVYNIFSKLDYCGIALLTVGSFVPWLYYSFYCSPYVQATYLACISGLGTACIVVCLWDRFAQPEYRGVRAGLFIALGLTGAIPAAHLVVADGLHTAMYECGLGYLILMATLYITGALIYATRVPESLYPGKFDIWFHSHQIFHVFVLAAALVHYQGIQIVSHYRHAHTDCLGPME